MIQRINSVMIEHSPVLICSTKLTLGTYKIRLLQLPPKRPTLSLSELSSFQP